MTTRDYQLPLPPLENLAVAYAPGGMRGPTVAVLALDQRLAGIVRSTREPMLAQIKLAWWRERLGEDAEVWPQGEPLLASLRSFDGRHGWLEALVEGWEALIGEVPLPAGAIRSAAEGRAAGFVALHTLSGAAPLDQVRTAALQWAAADLAMHLSDPGERADATRIATEQPGKSNLPRSMRPLVVLRGVALKRLHRGSGQAVPGDMLVAMRLGLLGR